jgi:hypothetical protein
MRLAPHNLYKIVEMYEKLIIFSGISDWVSPIYNLFEGYRLLKI